ncbi:FixH family protein [Christiangramia flava]|uniref:Cytochrome cbb3 oxidase maturation protein CcoH n=1 Tax=Christiangramia flava JLT2011 TaxID=1229726 RepID=A0A1L7I3X5_9FLAO|nr:FixH family protein [Christiangramia flava]APU68319.1 cytochrome cbb3 oxidase maturation protein CcoH [Christiangramia flava JLT2011]OSS40894.1 hypothetical protein C723_0303 [Christiangramia flava JLT2011]
MKTKFNWGTGLAIGMILFVSFILFLVTTMLTSAKYEHDLVTEDYYAAELHYQNDIDAEQNLQRLPSPAILEKKREGLKFHFPSGMDPEKIEGRISLYRPSNKQLDFNYQLRQPENAEIVIPAKLLQPGRWNLIVFWNYEGKEFLYKKELVY